MFESILGEWNENFSQKLKGIFGSEDEFETYGFSENTLKVIKK